MKPYSVLLKYPETMTDGELETYYAFVTAETIPGAVHAARLVAVAEQAPEAEYVPSDFGLLLLIEGHHTDYSYKEEEAETIVMNTLRYGPPIPGKTEYRCPICDALVLPTVMHTHMIRKNKEN